MSRFYIGIDNGVSGSIGIINSFGEGLEFTRTPVKSCVDFQKDKKNITRLDTVKLYDLLERFYETDCLVVMERPMINPGRWVATYSAVRCHEAMLVVLEMLSLPVRFIDSKEWQRSLLSKDCHHEFLKTESLQVGNTLYPQFKSVNHPDRDGLLVAEYVKNEGW